MSVRDLHRLREEYRKSADSFAHEFRLSFAEVVIDRLRELGWTQKTLSARLGVTEPLVSRLLNAEHNWSSDSAGKVLFALGIRARVRRQDEHAGVLPNLLRLHRTDGTHDKIRIEGSEYGETAQQISIKTGITN